MKLILILLLSLFSGLSLAFEHESEITLSLEKIQLKYQRLMHEYQDLKSIDGEMSLEQSDELIDAITEEYIGKIESREEVDPGSLVKIKDYLGSLKNEAKVLTRTHGLAISIIVLTFEITELPMKAVALSIGIPVVVVLYEVLQPAILVPAIIIGVKKTVKTIKTKKLFGDGDLFREWKKQSKAAQKETKIKTSKDDIGFYNDGQIFLVNNSNFLVNIAKPLGLFRKRLDYPNVKRQLRKNSVTSTNIELIKDAYIPKQLKVKLILMELDKMNSPLLGVLLENTKNFSAHGYSHMDSELTTWIIKVMSAHTKEETQSVLLNYPRSVSPLILMELWSMQILKEFFEHNQSLKLSEYRALYKNLLKVVVDLRKDALLSGEMPTWTSHYELMVNEYFSL